MIAFDLDGVFQPDIIFEEDTFPTMLEFRKSLLPLLMPDQPFALITGRPVQDKQHTWEWVDRMFHGNRPTYVHHENIDFDNPVLYKEKVLNMFATRYTLFVESDVKQVRYLNERVAVPVVHFETVVMQALNQFRRQD